MIDNRAFKSRHSLFICPCSRLTRENSFEKLFPPTTRLNCTDIGVEKSRIHRLLVFQYRHELVCDLFQTTDLVAHGIIRMLVWPQQMAPHGNTYVVNGPIGPTRSCAPPPWLVVEIRRFCGQIAFKHRLKINQYY